MTSTARPDSAALADEAYRALIAELSPTLPRCLEPADVKLTSDDLALVLAHFGTTVITEALERDVQPNAPGKVDTYDLLAIRVTMPLNTAITACGLAVMQAVQNYAAQLVYRDVQAFRDANPPRRRESLASEYGVAGLVTGGAL